MSCGVTQLILRPIYQATVHCYASVTSSHTRTGAWASDWGEKLPAFVQLVVCELPDDSEIHLLGLDPDGHVQFDSEHQSIGEAKLYAESEYQGLAAAWQTLGASNASDT